MNTRALLALIAAFAGALGACQAPAADDTAEQGGAATASDSGKVALVNGPAQRLIEKQYSGCFDVVKNELGPGVKEEDPGWGPKATVKVLCTDEPGLAEPGYTGVPNGLFWGWQYQKARGSFLGVAGGIVMDLDPACAGCIESRHVWGTDVRKLKPVGATIVLTFDSSFAVPAKLESGSCGRIQCMMHAYG